MVKLKNLFPNFFNTMFDRNKIEALEIEFFKQYGQLFVIDIARTASDDQYPDYEKRERYYAKWWFSAYNKAFSIPLNGKISQEVLQEVHYEVM